MVQARAPSSAHDRGRRQRAAVEARAGRPPRPGPSGSATPIGSGSGGRPRDRQVAARVDHGPPQPRSCAFDGPVDRPALGDPAEVERGALRQEQHPAVELHVCHRGAAPAEGRPAARRCEQLVVVPVVPGGEQRRQDRRVEQPVRGPGGVERPSGAPRRTSAETACHRPAPAFTRLSSLSARNREKRASTSWNSASTAPAAGAERPPFPRPGRERPGQDDVHRPSTGTPIAGPPAPAGRARAEVVCSRTLSIPSTWWFRRIRRRSSRRR